MLIAVATDIRQEFITKVDKQLNVNPKVRFQGFLTICSGQT